jgi:hypothetical protein
MGFDALLKFYKREGHCLVPTNHIEIKFELGAWCILQRTIKNTLKPLRQKRLNEINFIWDSRKEKWEMGFDALLKFYKREGHCLVPKNHFEDDYKLGVWIENIRSKKLKLSKQRIQRLNEINFIWDARKEKWEVGFDSLLKFHKREGHCLVPVNHIEDGFKLGRWVDRQRVEKINLSQSRMKKLATLNFSWNSLTTQWDLAFEALLKFKKREGHCVVSLNHSEEGINLYNWIQRQRQNKLKLKAGQLEKLRKIGLQLNPYLEKWEKAYKLLLIFQKREGHCQVPRDFIESNYKLGKWVDRQRINRGNLSEENLKKLDQINFFKSNQ